MVTLAHPFNPRSRLYSVFTFQLLNMLKIKLDINQQGLKTIDLSNLNDFHSLEVVDRVSETRLQVGVKITIK